MSDSRPHPPTLTPSDEHNQRLLANVHPSDWANPTPAPRYNLVVIGAGTAGLVTAAGAAGLGAKVALIERHLMGGDCLNYGCVPSKTLLSAAKEAHRRGAPGNFGEVMRRVREVRANISRHDSAQRFRDLGIDVFLGQARFLDRATVEVDGRKLSFSRACVATGARAALPPIPGLSESGALTNETVFSLTEIPKRLAVLGAGPIGCELAQAFRRLGAEVTVITRGPRTLDREDPDAAEIVQAALEREGVRVLANAEVERVQITSGGKTLDVRQAGGSLALEADQILVGVGRVPNVDGLGLEAAGVNFDPNQGVIVDDRLRTTNPRIYAAGDICLRWKFTHSADFAARIVIQNALFWGRKKLSALTIPWCTYTEPELAHVGLSASEAEGRGIKVSTWTRPFAEVDRAQAEGETEGFVRVVTDRASGRILGGTIVGSHAGDMISEISVAMAAGMTLGELASVIHPYPTRAEAIRQLGDAFNRGRLTPRVRTIFGRLFAWRR